MLCVSGLLLCLLAITQVKALSLQVEPKTEECFFEKVAAGGETIFVHYEVTRGGLLDIRFDVFFNDIMLTSSMHFSNEADGKFSHTSERAGTFKICFNNQMSRWTAKVVEFQVFVGEDHHQYRKNAQSPDATVSLSEMLLSEDIKALELEATKISNELEVALRSQKTLQNREKRHRETSEASSSRALWTSILEAVVLLAISGIQIYLVRSMFSDHGTMRRMV